MADIHHHGTIIEERDSMFAVVAALLVAALIGFLVWLFAFSGVVFNRNNNGGSNINIEQRQEQPTNAPAPGNS